VIATASGFLQPDGKIAKDRYYDVWDRIHTAIDCEPRERLGNSIREQRQAG
jgi:hypothetical protein